jgi:hypothetical protein
MAEALFIQTDDVVKFTALNGGLDVDKFIQFVKIAQDINIQGALGSNLYEKIGADILAGNLAGDYLILVNKYIKPMLIHWTMTHFLPFASYTIANKGVYKHGSENSTTVDKSEVDFLVSKSRDTAEHYTQRFLDYVCKYKAKFPEYSTNTAEDMKPETNNFFGGWAI